MGAEAWLGDEHWLLTVRWTMATSPFTFSGKPKGILYVCYIYIVYVWYIWLLTVDDRDFLVATACTCHMEQPAMPHHICIISACFPKLSEDAPLPAFFSLTLFSACKVTCHYWHSNRSFYLLTYWCMQLGIRYSTADKSGYQEACQAVSVAGACQTCFPWNPNVETHAAWERKLCGF